MPTIQDQITQLASYTAQKKASEPQVTGTASAQLTQSEFLELMLQQYQYQDPMEPMDNAQMVAQQCQFSQLSATQELTNTINSNNTVTQALSLVGKSVVLQDPENAKNVLYGKVDAAYVDGKDSGVTVGGTNYNLKYVLYAYDGTSTSYGQDSSGSGGTTPSGGTTTSGGTASSGS